jgi:hypothetical protein
VQPKNRTAEKRPCYWQERGAAVSDQCACHRVLIRLIPSDQPPHRLWQFLDICNIWAQLHINGFVVTALTAGSPPLPIC